MKKRTCVVCGEQYEYCPSCYRDKKKPTWMISYHSESCKKIWETLSQMTVGFITKEEAATALANCDLSRLEKFNPVIKKQVKELFDGKKTDVEMAEAEK
jgi:hypothetical protein